MIRSAGIMWSYTFCCHWSATKYVPQRHFARALSSSIVEPATLSRVTRIANCFFVPLSRKEWASTIAPRKMYQHHTKLKGSASTYQAGMHRS